MHAKIYKFLTAMDEALAPFAAAGEFFDMYQLGRSALILHYQANVATNDIDIIDVGASILAQKALALFGKDTALARKLDLYLEMIAPGYPSLPRWFKQRSVQVPGAWQVLRLWRLDVHDLAASKLKCFRPKDRADLQDLCDRGLINARQLYESLDAAFSLRSPKDGDEADDPDTPDWAKTLRNYHQVAAYLAGTTGSI